MYFVGEGFHIQNQKSKIKNQNDNSKLENNEKVIKTARVGDEGWVVVDRASEEEHKKAAAEALGKAKELMSNVDVLVLDEVNNAIDDELIDVDELIAFVSDRDKTHVVLTGRNAHEDVVELADLVTEMKKIKHPYDEGKLAVKGLDF